MKQLLKKFFSKSFINIFWHKPQAFFAAFRYGFPAKKMTVVAVAGTKGKTSTAYFISHILDEVGVKNALVCTAALKIAGEEMMNVLKMTTPSSHFLQKFFRQALKSGCTHVVLEVSSHAIEQHRVLGIPFPFVVLTNLMPDHLEYHATAEEYRSVHKKLITPSLKKIILNGNDQYLAEFIRRKIPKIIFQQSDTLVEQLRSEGVPMMHSFNISNILAAYHAVVALGVVAHGQIVSALKTLRGAPGRLERIDEGQPFIVIVDYAHSVDSLTGFFTAIKQETGGRIIVVYGGCGDRDPNQRPKMGEILDRNADSIVITNDDPYSENPETIAAQLMAGITKKKTNENIWILLDRKEAIKKALLVAQKGDIVCILGKGAEQWQVFKNTRIPWDDRTVVRTLLRGE